MDVKVKYLADIDPIVDIEGGNWTDLRCAEDIELKKGEFKLIPLGIAMQLPKGYEAIVAPRSSTFKKYKIIQTNSIGIIDESYCGDNDQWYLPVIAMDDTVIHKNDRICQYRLFEHQPKVNHVAVDTLGNEDRGGFGSTGIK